MVQESQTINWFDLLKWLLPGGSTVAVLTYLWAKYFRIRPKILLSIGGGGSTQSSDGPDRLNFTWRLQVVFHNDSVYKARRIRVLHNSGTASWKLVGRPPSEVAPDSKQEWPFEVHKSESREVLVSLCGAEAVSQGRLSESFLPHVLEDAKIVIAYDSERDTTFYSTLNIENGKWTGGTHRTKPKF